MINCLICGERITSTTTDTLCVPCRREKRRYIQEIVNTWDTDPYNDLVADLRKLVEKWEQYELPGEYESLYKDLKELLKRGE